GAPFDRKRFKSHLEAGQDCPKSGRTGDDDPILSLQELRETRTSKDLRIQTLVRQKHNCEISRSRRLEILRADLLRTGSDPNFESSRRFVKCSRVNAIGSFDQGLIVLHWKLGIQRQPDGFVLLAGAAWQ